MDQNTLLSANALLTVLHYDGVEAFIALLTDEPDVYNNMDVIMGLILIMHNTLDSLSKVVESSELGFTFADILEASANSILNFNPEE